MVVTGEEPSTDPIRGSALRPRCRWCAAPAADLFNAAFRSASPSGGPSRCWTTRGLTTASRRPGCLRVGAPLAYRLGSPHASASGLGSPILRRRVQHMAPSRRPSWWRRARFPGSGPGCRPTRGIGAPPTTVSAAPRRSWIGLTIGSGSPTTLAYGHRPTGTPSWSADASTPLGAPRGCGARRDHSRCRYCTIPVVARSVYRSWAGLRKSRSAANRIVDSSGRVDDRYGLGGADGRRHIVRFALRPRVTHVHAIQPGRHR